MIYVLVNRCAKNGVFQRVFIRLQQMDVIRVKVNVVSLDFTSIKVHPDGMGALKKEGRNPSGGAVANGTPNFIWSPHLIGML